MNRVRPIGGAPATGAVTGVALTAVVVGALVPFRAHITRATPALVLVLVVVAAGVVGGVPAAVLTAVVAAAAFNLAFIVPYWTFKVAVWDDWVEDEASLPIYFVQRGVTIEWLD